MTTRYRPSGVIDAPAGRDDHSLAEVLALSLREEPPYSALIAEYTSNTDRLLQLFQRELRLVRTHDRGHVRTFDDHAGAAWWVRHTGKPAPAPADGDALVDLLGRYRAQAFADFESGRDQLRGEVMGEIEHVHLRELCQAVFKSSASGVAVALLEDLLAHPDAGSAPIYTDAARPEVCALLEDHGFIAAGEPSVLGLDIRVSVQPMVRQPQPRDAFQPTPADAGPGCLHDEGIKDES